jgi:ubiquinone/menaquinone biosynthesis C-methylase UbiE
MEDPLRIEFNEWAKAGRGDSMERGHRPVGEQAIEQMSVKADAHVLDVGCGSGWASRLFAEKARAGRVVGIDISDEMIRVASEQSTGFANVSFQVASAESLPFENSEFTDAFSMESLYYYVDIARALTEIHRVLKSGGLFVTVVDLYLENEASHQWIEQLRVPVQLLSTSEYTSLFTDAGFVDIQAQRILDPTPLPDDYNGTSFKSREDFLQYRAAGSLMLSGRAGK